MTTQQPASNGSPIDLNIPFDETNIADILEVPQLESEDRSCIPIEDFMTDVALKCDAYYPCQPCPRPLCFTPEFLLGYPRNIPAQRQGFESTRVLFKGMLTSTSDPTFVKCVVCKMEILVPQKNDSEKREKLRSKKLHTEASAYYLHLRDLQGNIIPEFYGLFENTNVTGNYICCIFTQFHGSNITELPQIWDSVDTRKKIWSALEAIHKQEVVHGDLLPRGGPIGRNIVVDLEGSEPRIFLIDFEGALRHKGCEGAPPLLSMGPTHELDGCPELFGFGLAMLLYAPWSIFCEGRYIPLHSARSIEELCDSRFIEKPGQIQYSKDRRMKFAEMAWNEYMETYGDLKMVREVIDTLDKAPESGDASEEDNKQSDVDES